MKLMIAVVQKDDASMLSSALIEKGFSVTKLSTTGGFLTTGNTTLLIGVDDDKVEKVKEIIKSICRTREQIISTPMSYSYLEGSGVSCDVNVKVGGATVFVLNVEEFEKL